MSLTPTEEIHEALQEAYDPEYYGSLYRQTKYAFGEKYDDGDGLGLGSGGDFPDFAAIRVRQLAIGQSRRILTAQFVDLARNMYAPGDPEFPDVDKAVATVRKNFFLKRAEQGDWDTARCSAFIEGNGLGVGFLQGGVVTNPLTGKMRTHLRHSPTVFTLWDPHEPSVGRAGYICFVQHLPLHRAIALYGDEIEAHMVPVESGGRRIRTVRIFEYYDLGHGRWEPTQAIIPGRMTNEPLRREASLWTESLPVAFYEHLLPPMAPRPIGRIPLMMQTQEAINEIEAYLRSCSRKRAVDWIDPTFVDPRDLAKVEAGLSNALELRKPLAPGQMPMTRIPAEPIGPTALQFLSLLQQQFNEDSGTTEYDRGGKPDGDLTKYEVGQIQASNARQGGWTDKQTAKFAVRTIELTEMIAKEADEDPVELNVMGHAIPFNDPADPSSSIAEFVSIPSRVLVAEESLRRRDQREEGAVRVGQLQTLVPYLGRTIDPVWFTEELLKGIGEHDTQTPMLNAAMAGQNGATQAGATGAGATSTDENGSPIPSKGGAGPGSLAQVVLEGVAPVPPVV